MPATSLQLNSDILFAVLPFLDASTLASACLVSSYHLEKAAHLLWEDVEIRSWTSALRFRAWVRTTSSGEGDHLSDSRPAKYHS